MAAIHCRYCGTDNPVASDVIGKTCENCGHAIYLPDFEREMAKKPATLKGLVDRTGDIPRVACPHCRFVNEFPGFDMIYIFLCDECGEPVEGAEIVQ